jgi:hypothetical protein
MTDEPEVIVVVLRAPRAIADWCALRRALKALLRQLGLKCVRITTTEKRR